MRIPVGLFLLTMLCALPARAQSGASQWCELDQPPGRADGGCTAIINAGELDRQTLWRAYFVRADAKARLGQTDAGRRDQDEAIKLKPDAAEDFYNLGNRHLRADECALAVFSYNRAIELKPGMLPFWVNRGACLERLGQHGQAEADFNAALRLDPNDVRGLVNRARVYNATHRYELALADLDRAVALAPDLAQAWASRGVALHGLGRDEEALENLKKADRLDPNMKRP